MNAAREFASALPRHALVRMLRALRWPDDEVPAGRAAALRAVSAQFELGLVAFLNHANRAELDAIASALALDTQGSIGALRARLWLRGAEREAGGELQLGKPWQPMPVILGGKLVYMRDRAGIAPAARELPRAVPEERAAPEPLSAGDEPDCMEDLLARASELVGVRLGERGRDKGEWGSRIAAMLGVAERGFSEPDWRGLIEIKTLPVVRDRSGFWRVKEDPAVSMERARPIAKLGRVLWVARAADAERSPVLSWFYQELDAVRELVARDLHRRPKGGAGATTRGWYLRKRFFSESGFLRSLNGG